MIGRFQQREIREGGKERDFSCKMVVFSWYNLSNVCLPTTVTTCRNGRQDPNGERSLKGLATQERTFATSAELSVGRYCEGVSDTGDTVVGETFF